MPLSKLCSKSVPAQYPGGTREGRLVGADKEVEGGREVGGALVAAHYARIMP